MYHCIYVAVTLVNYKRDIQQVTPTGESAKNYVSLLEIRQQFGELTKYWETYPVVAQQDGHGCASLG